MTVCCGNVSAYWVLLTVSSEVVHPAIISIRFVCMLFSCKHCSILPSHLFFPMSNLVGCYRYHQRIIWDLRFSWYLAVSWRWRWKVHPECWYLSSRLCGFISHDYNLNNLKIRGFQSNENLDCDQVYDMVVLYMVKNPSEDSGSIIYSKDYNLKNNPYMWLF
jgi:hypothetical protein